MTLDSLPDLDTSGLSLVKTLSTALTCWPYRNMALRDGARTSTWWWACESRRGRSGRGSGRCSGLSVVRGRLRGLSWGNRPHFGADQPRRRLHAGRRCCPPESLPSGAGCPCATITRRAAATTGLRTTGSCAICCTAAVFRPDCRPLSARKSSSTLRLLLRLLDRSFIVGG